MRGRLAFATLAAATVAGCAASVSLAANSTGFADGAGDSGTAPDITNVAVSNDDNGVLTMRLTIANRPTFGPQDGVLLGMETDGNLSNGVGGLDYFVAYVGGIGFLASGASGKPVQVSPQNPLSISYAGGVLTIVLNRADIGSPAQINFNALTSSDGFTTNGDWAPNTGFWTYLIAIGGSAAPPAAPPPPPAPPTQALVLKVDKLIVSKATAGLPLLVTEVLERTDSGDLLDGGKVTCAARVGSAPLRVVAKTGPKMGAVICSWIVPKGAHGKRLTGSIVVTYNGVTSTKAFSARVA